MAKDRIYINGNHRAFLDEMKRKNILFDSIAENKDLFLMAVALGINSPADGVAARDGFILLKSLKTSDKALLGSVLLKKAETDEQIDECSDFDKSLDLCELCAETGFGVLQSKVNDAGWDSDLLARRLLNELDFLYTKQIADDV